jgi:hypothetical protein
VVEETRARKTQEAKLRKFEELVNELHNEARELKSQNQGILVERAKES